MRDVERDGEHMWLRQSVTFSVDGQSRTVEIGIPLRAGATSEEIEALLAEADAGMERIGRHLEARIARLSGMEAPSAPSVPAAAPSVPAAEPAPSPAPAPARDVVPPASPAPASTPATAAPPAPAPVAATPAPARTIAERPAPPVAAPAPGPAKPPAAAPEHAPVSPPSGRASTAADAGAPLALKDFIAAVQAEQGLNPKQAMEKLGVKSLAGLNLREALEMLRRQALRDGAEPAPNGSSQPSAAPAPPVPAPAAPAAPAPTTATATAAAAAPPRYFEEEDDAADIIFTEDDDEPLDLDDDEELDEVPDFGSPPGDLPAVEPVAAATAAETGQAPAATSAHEGPAAEGNRAARILTHMRGMRGGGAVSAHQRSAFKNIVVAELGEPKAKALIAGIWRITPEKLGPEQLDALNNWGKRETFAEDTELVLAAVRAERERERAGVESSGEADQHVSPAAPTSAPPAPSRTTPRRTSRATSTGGA